MTLVLYTWCLRYNIYSTWILDIRISICSNLFLKPHKIFIGNRKESHGVESLFLKHNTDYIQGDIYQPNLIKASKQVYAKCENMEYNEPI